MNKLLISFFIALIAQSDVNAQGCVAVRQMGGIGMCTSNGYNLSKGSFQVGTNYRYFHSWRHYVGREEQPERQETGGGHGPDGKDRGNAVNIYSHAIDLNMSYGLTDRLQFNVTLPWVHNERSQVLRTSAKDTFRYSVYAKGVGDIRFGLSYWVIDPAKAHKGNLMIGTNIKLRTGSWTETDEAPQTDGTTKTVMMDQAIQPGDGGVGFSLELQGFTQLYKSIYGFANAYYLFNPKESNGSFKSPHAVGLAGYNIYASPDQYFARAGVMSTVDKAQRLSLSLAGRIEGIPAYDVLGGQVAYRRPGYVVAVEPGVSYHKGQHNISLFVPVNVVRDRIQSAADIATQNLRNANITDISKLAHVQGDAAFADYSISVGYSYRFVKKAKALAHFDPKM
ncbi:MAG: hypothetical protein V4725_15725 [Bacteroidota bacterium]